MRGERKEEEDERSAEGRRQRQQYRDLDFKKRAANTFHPKRHLLGFKDKRQSDALQRVFADKRSNYLQLERRKLDNCSRD